ncbi:uncharacterized protein A4U43_C09F12840 [Asparagus officinalis]|uniref:Uncharacterized protein n=1 Tax=Asparagus officinalis TaxID=4686 RepID=A0A5P1EA96_ASPOF|nr:uncharacterized protein A4U43_C09F12840 [Asparagus officinalis]
MPPILTFTGIRLACIRSPKDIGSCLRRVRRVGLLLQCFLAKGKEHILLDDEEQVDYEFDETDTYLTAPDDRSFDGDIGDFSFMPNDEHDFGIIGGAVPMSFLASGNFEPVANFEGGVLKYTPTIDTTVAFASALISLVWHKQVVHESFVEDDDGSVSPIPVGVGRVALLGQSNHCLAQTQLEATHHKNDELELKSTELVKEWDLRAMELEAETKRLAVIMTQAALVDPRVLREKAQRDAQEVRDSRIAECFA